MQLLKNYKMKDIQRIYLTASGGPFFEQTRLQLKKIKPEQALKHPKWKMGRKLQ